MLVLWLLNHVLRLLMLLLVLLPMLLALLLKFLMKLFSLLRRLSMPVLLRIVQQLVLARAGGFWERIAALGVG